MKIGFYLAHPAHYHLFKNTIHNVSKYADVLVVYNQKDVLRELTKGFSSSITVKEVQTIKSVNNKIGLLIQFVQKNIGAYKIFRKEKPDLVFGTPILVPLIGKILQYKSFIVNEDDFDIVKKTADFGYPYATGIICPDVCRTGKFKDKSITYHSYHELAYLHPNHFTPDKLVVEKYFNATEPYFIIRFAKLKAHHDTGISGIDFEIAKHLLAILQPHGKVYISSERKLEPEFESFRIVINPLDMHHIMAFAKLYIGDSQTMAAESGVLGTPFIRFNDFVGRIGYLADLEDNYQLGYGIKPSEPQMLFQKVQELMKIDNLKEIFSQRRQKMLSEKIDAAKFLSWFIKDYPKSIDIMKTNPEFQFNFK